MTTTIEYALMAGASYISTRRNDGNKFPIPQGWNRVSYSPPVSSGFEAAAFGNAATLAASSEIVISFAGTYDQDYLGDMMADAGLAMGFGSDQLLQAIRYYLDVKASAPAGTTITLTGHSLGGGLAALVSVFFGVSATTFDQAPFANSAQAHSIFNPLDITSDVAVVLKTSLHAAGYTDAELAPLTNFLSVRDAVGGIPNSNLINNIRVDGEFLSVFPIGMYDTIGSNSTNITTTRSHHRIWHRLTRTIPTYHLPAKRSGRR